MTHVKDHTSGGMPEACNSGKMIVNDQHDFAKRPKIYPLLVKSVVIYILWAGPKAHLTLVFSVVIKLPLLRVDVRYNSTIVWVGPVDGKNPTQPPVM